MQSRHIARFVAFFFLCTLSLMVHCQDNLDEVLQRFSVKHEPVEISYKETRLMQLLRSPWQGAGEIYISAEKMIIAQQSPKKLFISITAQTLEYLDTQQNIYHVKKLNGLFKLPQMAAFVDLIYGNHNAVSLKKKYLVEFSSDSEGWRLSLSDKNDNDVERAEIFGQNGLSANKLEMLLNDGDKTTWVFIPANAGADIVEKMNLIGKMIGDHKNAAQLKSLGR